MLHQLIAQLRHDLQLPRCLQIVGYLRQMDVFTEAELRLKFLQARNTWLQESLDSIPTNDGNSSFIWGFNLDLFLPASHHLNKTIEITRINLFSIINQYRAIFNDDEHSPMNAARNKDVNENLIFYSWLQEKISAFLTTLKSDLKHGGGVLSIDSIMSQCMYFGLSFSRVGCDFRVLMIPIFTETILELFSRSVAAATRDFEKNMERFTLINKNCPTVTWHSTTDVNSLQPPEKLLEFYPLAEYCNQILGGLNEMRLCAPFAIIPQVFEALEASLGAVSRTIFVFYGQEQQAFSPAAKEAFGRLCVCFADELVPYFQRCLDVLFSPAKIAQNLGVSVQTLQGSGFAVLDRNAIIQAVSHLLPVKIDPMSQEITEHSTT